MMKGTNPGELRGVLAAHARRYPLLQPQDAVKLIYQNEFGGGHLIADPEQSLQRLRAECRAVQRDPDLPLAEEIGNGLVRVMLPALDGQTYPLAALNRDFVRSARRHAGAKAAFLDKLGALRALTAEGVFGFSPEALEAYLAPYIAAGCPPVSHSEVYRRAYRPAYRVVQRAVSLPLLLAEIAALQAERGRVLVALDGRCASGKSTLGATLAARFGWSLAHMDDFFLRPEQRTPERYATPGENVDHERFLAEVLQPLRDGRAEITYRPLDCRTFALADPVSFRPAPVTIIEGSYSCHPALWDLYDLHVFLTVDPAEQLRRIGQRNGEAGLQMFREKWIPLEELYFSACGLEAKCDYALDAESVGAQFGQ